LGRLSLSAVILTIASFVPLGGVSLLKDMRKDGHVHCKAEGIIGWNTMTKIDRGAEKLTSTFNFHF
jgi:hypothetical protein